jgi:hypothetical protein
LAPKVAALEQQNSTLIMARHELAKEAEAVLENELWFRLKISPYII